jgi:peptidyl-tRNA hydrolase, PTH1 family
MRLLVGLGNPGPQYAHHRHNVGFMAVDEIVRRHRFAAFRERFQGAIAEGMLTGDKVLALKPLTYMNESGRSVAAAARFYKIEPEDVIVFHDELDLAPGKVRAKKGGGAAGHNGLRSIDSHIGPEFWRIRIGIGHPGHKDLVHSYVLHDFAKADEDWLSPLIGALASEAPLLAAGDAISYMSRVALLTQPPKPRKTGTEA